MKTRFVAFLRAINVGGHIVKMDYLRKLFESLGLEHVETFIASGNVIFESDSDPQTLENQIRLHLRRELGYDVPTFIRTVDEVAAIADYQPFSALELDVAAALNVSFLHHEPDAAAAQKLMSFVTDIDDFHIHQRQVYWMCRKKQSESTFSNAVLEKALGQSSTLRGISTVEKLAQKHAKTS